MKTFGLKKILYEIPLRTELGSNKLVGIWSLVKMVCTTYPRGDHHYDEEEATYFLRVNILTLQRHFENFIENGKVGNCSANPIP